MAQLKTGNVINRLKYRTVPLFIESEGVMKYKIHYNGAYEDEIIIEGDTIEELREKAFLECDKRGWNREDCWSEEIR